MYSEAYGIDIGKNNFCIVKVAIHKVSGERSLMACRVYRLGLSGRVDIASDLYNAMEDFLSKHGAPLEFTTPIYIEQQNSHWRHILFGCQVAAYALGMKHVHVVSSKAKYKCIPDCPPLKDITYRARKKVAVNYLSTIDGAAAMCDTYTKKDDIADAVLVGLQGLLSKQ